MLPLIYRLLSERRNFYHNLVEFPAHHIYRNDRENTAYNRICSDEMDITAMKFVKKMSLMLSAALVSIGSTFYASFWLGIKTTIRIPNFYSDGRT